VYFIVIYFLSFHSENNMNHTWGAYKFMGLLYSFDHLAKMGSVNVVSIVGVLDTHLGFIFPNVFPIFISHYSISYILGRIFLYGEYSLQFTLQFDQLNGV
jgi:hypothetical protein